MKTFRFPLLLLSLAFLANNPTSAADAPKLNVLFIIADDLNTDLGCYGDPVVKSPSIDALAKRGVRFERAYCQYPVCGPSRASFMTSMRPNTTRVLTNAAANSQGGYNTSPHFRETLPDTVTMSQLFRRQGWWSARVGKIYHYGVPGQIGTNGLDDPPSWDHRVNPIGRDKAVEDTIFSLQPEAPLASRFGGVLSWKQMDGSPLEQTDGIGATEAIKLMEAKRDGPFFLAVGFYRPHTPYVATKEFYDLYPPQKIQLPAIPAGHREAGPVAAFASLKAQEEAMPDDLRRQAIQGYHASISMMDAQVGRVLEALDRLKLREKTIVVFTSDHGYHMGTHSLWQKNTLWENSARVPLIIAAPGMKQAGQSAAGVVEMLDIYPTVADLAGVPLAHPLQGVSLRPMLDNPTAIVKPAAFTQVRRAGYSGYSVRTVRYRYTEWEDGTAGTQLYDLTRDPGEFTNLAADPGHRAVVAEMKAHLARNWPPGVWTPGADEPMRGKKKKAK
ncbi:MAG: Choline-sulfatase [Verrucomicrobiota bacterium]|jgi:arylsulfatase A-like enzyme